MAKSMDSISKVAADKPATPVAAPPAAAPATPPVEQKPAATPAATPAVPETPTAAPTAAPVTPAKAAAAVPGQVAEVSTTKEEDTYEKLFPEPSVAIEGPPQWVWWVLLVIGSVVLGLIGYRLASGGYANGVVATSASPTPSASASASPAASASPSPSASASPAATATPTPSATATPAASATATPVVSKASITMRVLNGTTASGAAATAKATLTQAGYTVRTVGNAANQNYTSTVIYYQTGKLAQAQSVQQALSAYKPTLQESTSLASPDQLLVVVGPR